MSVTFKRILLFSIYLAFGVSVCYFIFLVNRNVVPFFGSVLNSAKIQIMDCETEMIYNNRPDSRNKSIAWLNEYKNDKSKLLAPERILLGVHDNHFATSSKVLSQIEEGLNTDMALIHIYTAWGSEPEQEFPFDQVIAVTKMGSIPVITWEPWLQAFSDDDIAGLRPIEERDNNGMADVAKGLYDDYIVSWARSVAKVKSPVFLRLAHEMNDPYRYPWGPHNNSGKDFVAAWKHVYAIFKQNGADNCIWVWNPHLSYSMFDVLYPGDEYVDYLGVNVLNFGTSVSWSAWYSFEDLFAKQYDKLLKYKKPLMIAEFASLTSGGDRAGWYADALRDFPSRFPQVKALMFFHVSDDYTVSDKELDWAFINDQPSVDSIKSAMDRWK